MPQSDFSRTRIWLLGTTALLPVAIAPALAQSVAPNAAPAGGQVVAGQASIAQGANTTTIRQSTDRAAINWQSFNVGSSQSVQFQQPNAGSWTLNRVNAPDPSVIAGRISANGGIAIVNQSGVVFTGTAQVNVGSLIASTANITNENFMTGRLLFDQPGRPGARVENHGSITVADRGIAALVAPGVSNSGTIHARLGRVALQGAEAFTLDLAGDGLLAIDVTQAVRTTPSGADVLVTNSGTISAEGGSVLISAHAASGLVEDLVRQTGTVAANTAEGRAGQVAIRAEGGGVRVSGNVSAIGGAGQRGGEVALRGSTHTSLEGTARVDASGAAGGGTVTIGTAGVGRNQRMGTTTRIARGAVVKADATDRGNGGTIAVNAAETTEARGSFSARGGASGGDGGFIELSGQHGLTLEAPVDLAAPRGRAGTLLIDPDSIEVVAGGGGSAEPGGPGLIVAATTTAGVTQIDPATLEGAGVDVRLQATNDIAFRNSLDLTGQELQLWAGGAITQDAGTVLTANQLTIRGANGTDAAGTVTLGGANRIGILDALVNTSLTFVNAGALTVARAQGPSVNLSTTAGALTLTGAVGGAGAMVTLFGFGDLTQTAGGIITAGTLEASSFSKVDLTQANAVLNFQSTAAVPETLAFTSTKDLTVGRVQTSDTGSLTLIAPSLAIGVVNGSSSLFGAKITLTATAGSITQRSDVSIRSGASPVELLQVSATGDILLPGLDNHIGAVVASATGAVDIFTKGDLAVTRAAGTSVALASSGTLTITPSAGSGGLGVAATGAVSLDAGGKLTIGAVTGTNGDTAVRSTGGGTVSLRADSLNWVGVAATGGVLEIGPHTAATPLHVGGAGELLISPDAINDLAVAGTLRLGETTIGASTLRASSLTVSAALQPTAAVAANGLELVSDGTITVASALGRVATPGTVLLRSGDAVALQAETTASTLSLFADGAISQTLGGPIVADTLLLRGDAGGVSSAGSFDLTKAANAIGTLDARSTGAASFAQGAGFTVNQAVSAGTLSLRSTSGAIAFNGAVAGTTVLAQASALTQTAGSITAAQLTALAATGITLNQANAIGAIRAEVSGKDAAIGITTTGTTTVAASASGAVAFSAGALVVGTVDGLAGITAPSVALTTTKGTLTQTAALLGPTAAGTALTFDSFGDATLTEATNKFSSVAGSGAAGASILSATAFSVGATTVVGALSLETTGGSIDFAAAVAAGTLRAEVTDALTQSAGTVTTDQLTALAATGITLNQANAIGAIRAEVSGKDAAIGVTTTGTTTIAASAPGAVTVTAGALVIGTVDGLAGIAAPTTSLTTTKGTLTQTATLTGIAPDGSTALAFDTAGDATLTLAGNRIASVAGTSADGAAVASTTDLSAGALTITDALSLQATGAAQLDFADTVKAGTITAAGSSITQSGGTLAADRLTALATGAITLDQANALAALRVETTADNANASVTTTGTTTIAASVTGIASFTAGTLVIGTVDGLAGIHADVTRFKTSIGGVTQTADLAGTGAGETTAVVLLGGPGDVVLDSATNAIRTLRGSNAGSVTIASASDMTLAQGLIVGGAGNDQSLTLTAKSLGLSDAVSAANISLTTTKGDLTQNDGSILGKPDGTGTALTVNATGNASLAASGNLIATVTGSSTGALAITSAIGLTTGALSAGGIGNDQGITLTGPSLILTGATAAAAITLTATTGTITQDKSGLLFAPEGAGTRLTTVSAGATTLDQPGNVIADATLTAGSLEAPEAATLASGTDLTLRTGRTGAAGVSDLTVTAQSLVLDGVRIGGTLRAAATLGTGGRITQTAALAVGGSIAAMRAKHEILLDRGDNAFSTLGTIVAGMGATSDAENRLVLRSANGLVVGGAMTVGVNPDTAMVTRSGGLIELIADSIAQSGIGSIQAPGGTVNLAPTTDGLHVALGRAAGVDDVAAYDAARELSLSAALLQSVRADTLVIGAAPSNAAVRAGSIRQYSDNIDLGYAEAPTLLDLEARGYIRQRGASGSVADEATGTGGAGGAAGTRGTLRIAALTATSDTGDIWLGADNAGVTLRSLTAPGAIVVRLAAGEALDIAGPVVAGSSGAPSAVTLVADSITTGASALVSAPGGSIAVLPRTAGRSVTLGSVGVPAGLVLGSLGWLGNAADPTSLLVIGRSTDTAVAGNAAWASDFAIGRQEGFIGDAGATAAGPRSAGDIRLGAGTDFTGRIGQLDLFAGVEGTATGSITQSAGTLAVTTLSGESRKGTVIGNAAIDTLAGFRAGTAATALGEADFGLGDGSRALAVTAAVTAGLRADDSIAARLGRIELAAGSLTLAADLTAPQATGSAEAAGDNTSLVLLRAATGAIQQSAGRILAGRLSALAPNGAITLGATGNAFNALVRLGDSSAVLGAAMSPTESLAAVLAGGDIVLTTLRNTGSNGGAVTLEEASRALRITGDIIATAGAAGSAIADADAIETAGARYGDYVTTGAGHSISITADDLDLLGRIQTNGGTLRLARLDTAPADIVLGSRIAATDVGMFLSAGELARIDTLGALPFGAPAGTAPPGQLTLVSTRDIRLGETVSVTDAGELHVVASGDFTQAAGAILSARSLSGDIGGAIALAAADNQIAVVRGLSAGGDIALRFGGAGLVAGYDAATGVPSGPTAARITGTSAGYGLRSGGNITIEANDLDLRAQVAAEGSAITLRPAAPDQEIWLSRSTPEPAIGSALSLTPMELGHLGFTLAGSSFGTARTDGTLAFGADTAGMLRLGAYAPAADTLALISGRGIEQSDAVAGDRAAALTVGTLRARVATATQGAIWLGADNRIGSVTAEVVGGATGSSLTIAQEAGRSLAVGAAGLSVPVGGRITLVADRISLGGMVSARSGAAVDGLSLGANFGTVEIAPRTRGRAVAIGGAQADSLVIDAAALAQIDTSASGGDGLGVLRIGASQDQAVAGNGSGLAAIGGSQTTVGTGDVTAGAITILAATDLTATARQLEVFAGAQGDPAPAAITQAGALTVTRLSGAATGDILLPMVSNQIQLLAPRFAAASGAGLTAGLGIGADAAASLRVFSAAPLLTVTGQVAVGGDGVVAVDPAVARLLELRAADLELTAGLLASRGTVLLAPLTETGATAILLGTTGTGLSLSSAEIAGISTREAGGSAGTLQIGLAGATAGSGTGAITLGGDVALSDGSSARVATLRLATGIAADGTKQGVTQTAGTLSTPTLSGSIAGGLVLNALGNRISRITDLATGADTSIAVGLADASGVPLLDAQGMPIGGTGPLRLDRGPGGFAIAMAGSGVLSLAADGLAIEAGDGTLRADAATVLLQTRSAGRAVLLGGGADADGLALDSAEITAIGQAAAPIARLRIGSDIAGAMTLLGDVRLRDVAVDAAVASSGDRVLALELRSSAAIAQTGGSLGVADLAAVGASVALDSAGNQIDRLVGATADGAPLALLDAGLSATTTTASLTTSRALAIAAEATAGTGLGITAGGAGASLTLAAGQRARSTAGNATLLSTAGDIAILGDLAAPAGIATAAATLGNASLSGSVTGAAAVLSAGGDATLSGGRLEGGTATLSAGRDAVLQAGALMRSTAGAASVTAGQDIAIGTATLDATGSLALRAMRNVRLEATAALAATGALTITAGGTLATAGRISTDADATLTGTAGITQTAGLIAADTIALDGGPITQAAAGADIQARQLSVTSTGAVLLGAADGHANRIGEVTRFTAAGAGSLRAAGDLVVTGPVQGGAALALRSDGAMTLTAAASVISTGGGVRLLSGTGMTATGTRVNAQGGDATLHAGGDGSFIGARISARDSLSVTAAGSLAFTDVALDSAVVVLEAGAGLTVNRMTASATSTFTLSAGGTVALTASAFTADILNATAGGVLSLDGVTMMLGNGGLLSGAAITASNLTAGSGGTLALQAAGDLGVTGSGFSGGSFRLAATGGAATLSGTTVNGTALAVTAGGALAAKDTHVATLEASFAAGGTGSFTGSGLTATDRLAISASGGLGFTDTSLDAAVLRVTAGQDLGATRLSAASSGNTSLSAAGAASLADSGFTAATFDATAGGVLDLDGVTLTLGNGGLLSGGRIAANDVTATSGGTLRLQGAGNLGVSASDFAGGSFELAATGGAATLSGITATGTGLVVTAGGALAADDLHVATGDASFSAGGVGTFTRSSISASNTLAISASGGLSFTDVTLDPVLLQLATDGDLNATGLIGISAGGFGLSAGGNLTLRDSSFTAETLQAAAGGALSLNGVTAQLGSGGLLSGGSVAIDGLTASAGGLFRIAAAGTLALVDSSFSADVVEAVAGRVAGDPAGTVSLSGVTMTLGTGAFLAGGGGVAMPGVLTIQPRSAGSLPVVVTEARQRPDAYTALPASAVPDMPGLQAREQKTQVATRTSPSVFSPAADTGPAGDVLLNLVAGDSPVFLLLDGGQASGQVEAGRLGIHGGNGGSAFTGQLAGVAGGDAAGHADVSRSLAGGTPSPESQQFYRFNNCVIGAVTCNTLAVLQPLPVVAASLPDLRFAPVPRDPDTLLPNIAAEDY